MTFFHYKHGKGLSDGIGGTTKRESMRFSLQCYYHYQILTPNELFEFIRPNLHGTNVKLLLSMTVTQRRNVLVLEFWK